MELIIHTEDLGIGQEPMAMTMERPLPNEVTDQAQASKPIATEPFYPHHVIRQSIQILVVFAIITSLATLYPAPMGPPADPTQMPETLSPEWVFMAAHHVLEMAKLLPVAPKVQQTIGVSVVVVGFLVVLLVPFIDRRAERRPRKRLLAMALLALTIAAYTALTLWPYWKRYVQ